jgi:hypothetical protein
MAIEPIHGKQEIHTKIVLSYDNVSESALHVHTCLRSYHSYPLDNYSECSSSSKHRYVRLHQTRQTEEVPLPYGKLCKQRVSFYDILIAAHQMHSDQYQVTLVI